MQIDKSSKDFKRASQHFSDVVLVTKNLMEEKRLKKAKQKCVYTFLRQSKLDANEVPKTIDNIGISRDAYNQIFQLVQSKVKEAKAKATILPRPSFMRNVRLRTNEQIVKLLGQPYHITAVFQGKEKEKRYDEYNNMFLDLILIQEAMIRFYNLSREEGSGVAKFVIKFDESKIFKCIKFGESLHYPYE